MADTHDPLVLFRGGGDLATGAIWRLWRAGFSIIVCELAHPLTVRRTVSVSTAVADGEVQVEGMSARLVANAGDASVMARRGVVAVIVSPELPAFGLDVDFDVIVDARMAKRNIDTKIDDARLVIGLGPGFEAGVDVHAVVETMRGPRLGRVLWNGTAAPNTGVPGEIGGRGSERVVRAPADGEIEWCVHIGSKVAGGDRLGTVAGQAVNAPFAGIVRGLIASGSHVECGLKIADVDPRADVDCMQISDKALAVGGGVMEAVATWRSSL